ncbi:MAG: hypothetical protein Unbinned4512contig1001_35 [Prokaryotic dsDNA virus sp.]|nr:MAG: hypothetical protein Unbinned4512contig1001_35 [Prokaryotic dsDNA virus sp.]|tara:strand:- start:1802 stop:1972 length:171 start_codon:yes stop_codon:yes gene_type:complete
MIKDRLKNIQHQIKGIVDYIKNKFTRAVVFVETEYVLAKHKLKMYYINLKNRFKNL